MPISKNDKNINWKLLIALIIALVIVGSLWYWNFVGVLDSKGKPDGAFGDKFGMVNSLFSGLAFAGIIITIYMQKHELELQREELAETRTVFKGQNELMTAQQNDNTFFNLLENHRQLVESFRAGNFRHISGNGIDYKGITEPVSGYEVLAKIVTGWQEEFKEFVSSYDSKLIVKPQGNFINRALKKSVRHPLEVIMEQPSMLNLFNDILVLFQFIEKQFSIDKQTFYKTILWNNISENEKFIFECFYVNRPELREGLDHQVSVYSKFDYPDFLEIHIPDLKFRSSVYAEGYAASVQNSENVISARLLCYEDKSWDFKLWSVHPLSLSTLHVYLADDLSVGGMSYHELSSDAMNAYKNRNYAIEVNVEHQSQHFIYVIGIDSSIVSSSTFDGKFRLSQDGIRIISRDTAETLVSLANETKEN